MIIINFSCENFGSFLYRSSYKDHYYLTLLSLQMLESALTRLLEGRHVSQDKIPDSLKNENQEIYDKFWSQLQMLLKKMLSLALSTNTNKSCINSEPNTCNRSGDSGKLRELYKMSLKPTDFSQLHAMHNLWAA